MIYPTIYKYNAPYRGPRDNKELNKVMTGIKYDLGVVYNKNLQLGQEVRDNMDYMFTQKIPGSERVEQVFMVGDTQYGYLAIDRIRLQLEETESILDNVLVNLY